MLGGWRRPCGQRAKPWGSSTTEPAVVLAVLHVLAGTVVPLYPGADFSGLSAPLGKRSHDVLGKVCWFAGFENAGNLVVKLRLWWCAEDYNVGDVTIADAITGEVAVVREYELLGEGVGGQSGSLRHVTSCPEIGALWF